MATVNPWAKFQALLGQTQRYRATVVSVNTTRGISTVQLSSGDTLQVQGTSATAGAQVMVTDGVITSTLPDLPYSRVEVEC